MGLGYQGWSHHNSFSVLSPWGWPFLGSAPFLPTSKATQLSPLWPSIPLEGKKQVWQYDVIPILVHLLKDLVEEVRANAAGALMYATVTTEGEQPAGWVSRREVSPEWALELTCRGRRSPQPPSVLATWPASQNPSSRPLLALPEYSKNAVEVLSSLGPGLRLPSSSWRSLASGSLTLPSRLLSGLAFVPLSQASCEPWFWD